MNAVTGNLSWCTPQFLGEYNIALMVKEWRKNGSGSAELIGYVMRDMQVLVLSGPTGLPEFDQGIDVSIYPNPARNLFRINSDLHATVTITDLFGNILIKTDYDQKAGLDISGLKDGIYVVRISSESGIRVKKLTVDRVDCSAQ